MKTLLTLILLAATMASCGTEEKKIEMTHNAELPAEPEVEVMYFHGKQRCATCLAIEKVASETVAEKYASQLAGGKIRFRVIDLDSREGDVFANKYRIARSSLLVVNREADGSETVENMTGKAFANAWKNPDVFCAMLCDVIDGQFK